MERIRDRARIGVVLSAGGPKGVYGHAGFLLALERIGVRYQAIAGTSAGALVAAMAASGSRPSHMVKWIRTIRPKHYWRRDSLLQIMFHLLVRNGKGYTGIVSTGRLRRLLEKTLTVESFEDCTVPLYIVATNLTERKKEVFHSGAIAPRAIASAAIPGLVKAVRIGESLYVDGGVYDFTPSSAICCQEKLDVLLVHQIQNSDTRKPDNSFMKQRHSILHVLGRVIESVYENAGGFRKEGVSKCECGCEADILTLSQSLSQLNPLNTENRLAVLRDAFDLAISMVPRLLEEVQRRQDDTRTPNDSRKVFHHF